MVIVNISNKIKEFQIIFGAVCGLIFWDAFPQFVNTEVYFSYGFSTLIIINHRSCGASDRLNAFQPLFAYSFICIHCLEITYNKVVIALLRIYACTF